MQCPNCDTPIDEIEATTCPNCGEPLPGMASPEPEPGPRVVDLHLVKPGEYLEVEGRAPFEDLQPGGIGMATEEEEAAAEAFSSYAPRRHPASGTQPEKYYLFRVHTDKIEEDVWVHAATVTQAREAIFSSDIRPTPVDGSDSWGNGSAFHINRGRATKHLKHADHTTLPGGVSKYLDKTGVWVRVRTQGS